MMPLLLAGVGEDNIIRKVGGNPEMKKHLEDLGFVDPEMKKHLEDLGFVVGGTVSIVSEINGNLIVNVKDTRIAISREMAGKIMV